MLILLSPAKNLDWSPPPAGVARTVPQLAKETAALARVAKGLTRADLGRLMDLSDKLAALNWERFQAFDPKAAPETGKQAVLAFNGDVYQGLDAGTLSPGDLDWAQERLRILSGLYGVLRPLDAIQPYRLEMGTKLVTPKGENLYDFWGDRIAKALKAELKTHAEPWVLNLASEEYFSAVDVKALGVRVITPAFKDVKDGKARSVFLFVKRARGLMARWAIQNRIETPGAVAEFSVAGYALDPGASRPDAPVFVRTQPKPVAAAKPKAKAARH